MIDWRTVVYMVGILDLALGLSMAIPVGIAAALSEPDVRALGVSGMIVLGLGGICLLITRRPPQEISHREGFLVVGLGWLNAAAVGSLPFWLGGVLPHFADAFFESASGFTTTGASVLTALEGLPRGILLWRAMTHWFGGMGIILLSLAIFPLLGVGGMQLYKAEMPGPVPDRLKPRIAETAKALWKVYVLFTCLEVLALLVCGMGLYDAICHAFATLATGGFSTRSLSIESFQNPYVDWVVLLFMLIAGVNFSLHHRAINGNPGAYFRSAEFRFFVLLFLLLSALMTNQLMLQVYPSIDEAFRYATFQVGSILTTTGFTSADYEGWPAFSRIILFLLMFVGGCAGSTGGGMKCMRILILIKTGYRELLRLVHPHAVLPVKMDGKTIPEDVVTAIWGFFILYLGIFALSSLVMAAIGSDLTSAFVSVAACMGNIGPGLGSVGPTDNYAHIPSFGKWLLSLCMIVGRLEVYTLIVILAPAFWKR
jgi:trk system potassium uptake protein TrkH